MAIPLQGENSDGLPPMWEFVYGHMYREYGKRQARLPPEKRIAACLAPPEPWFVVIAGIMWEGIIQGFAWDVVKSALSKAFATLSSEGIAPSPASTDRSIRAGFETYEKDGRK